VHLLKILENIPLAPMTTFQVGGPARYFVEARSQNEAKDAVHYAAEHRLPLFVLGGGSNLVVADAGFPGLVLKVGLAWRAWSLKATWRTCSLTPPRASPGTI